MGDSKLCPHAHVAIRMCRDWEGKGGKFLEDCQIGEPHDSGAPDAAQPLAAGYAPHAYDEAKEKRLWDESLQLVGLA